MFAIFSTIKAYRDKNKEIGDYLGYPDGSGTDRYATEIPQLTKDGKYAMLISERVAHLFTDCEIVESVEYEETEND